MIRWLLGLVCWLFMVGTCLAEPWTFVAIADNRSVFPAYRNVLQEIRDMTANPAPRFPAVDFVLACGDMDPVAQNQEIYNEVLGSNGPAFFPARGNHEDRADLQFILQRILPTHKNVLRLRDDSSVTYYVDWKNIRLIVLDQYASGENQLKTPAVLNWIRESITAAPYVDHVFLALHDPYLLGVSSRGHPFWKLLLEYSPRVRAVFAGHTHSYSRSVVGDERGGIAYVNVGNAGKDNHGDHRQTIVEVMIDDGKVSFRVVQTPDGKADFRVSEQWSVQ